MNQQKKQSARFLGHYEALQMITGQLYAWFIVYKSLANLT